MLIRNGKSFPHENNKVRDSLYKTQPSEHKLLLFLLFTLYFTAVPGVNFYVLLWFRAFFLSVSFWKSLETFLQMSLKVDGLPHE